MAIVAPTVEAILTAKTEAQSGRIVAETIESAVEPGNPDAVTIT
jgi:hypothetical protein|tara:strand:- start:647 stop:778 length:132 start_codon:yes stop_codon:yes gene_type:complete